MQSKQAILPALILIVFGALFLVTGKDKDKDTHKKTSSNKLSWETNTSKISESLPKSESPILGFYKDATSVLNGFSKGGTKRHKKHKNKSSKRKQKH